MNQRVDNNHQPHVIQRYHVPSPQNNQYRRHDEAVYSMWMHFVIYCSLDPESINSHRQIEAEIAAFAHPQYEYPLESTNTLLLASSPKGYQSKNLRTSHHQCSFLDETLVVNPFTNVNRLDVFRSLSSGEGSQLFSSTRKSFSRSSSISSDYASAHAPSPAEDSLDVGAAAYPFSKSHISPNFRSMNSPAAIHRPLKYDDPLISFKSKNLLHILQPMDIGEHNLTEQQSNLFTATSHQYFKAKARTVSTIGLGGKAVHLDQVVLSGVDHMTSYTGVQNSSSVSDLADTSLYISHVAARTPERNSPLDFDMAPPTDISNMSSFSPSSVPNILRDP